jgi:serine/threonine-protein kinase
MAPPPRPSATRPSVGTAFDAVIARGMAKRPEDRFASAGDLARAASGAAMAAQAATEINPVQPPVTRQFAPAPPPPPQNPPTRKGFGTGQWLLAGAAFGVFAALLALVLWLVLGQNRTEPPTPSTTSVAPTTPPTTPPTSTSPTPTAAALPGTDAQGFTDYPGARCDAGSSPAALARTTQSVLVVCRSGPGEFYYRGVRLSDGAGIELADAVRSSGGFDVTNPTDGTRYQIRPDALTIMPSDGQPVTEPMVDFATS